MVVGFDLAKQDISISEANEVTNCYIFSKKCVLLQSTIYFRNNNLSSKRGFSINEIKLFLLYTVFTSVRKKRVERYEVQLTLKISSEYLLFLSRSLKEVKHHVCIFDFKSNKMFIQS